MLAITKSLTNNNLTIFRRTARLMGDNFEISIVGNDPIWANQHIDIALNEINRVEKLLSTFSDDSIINQINRNAGKIPVKVSAEIFTLFSRALKISELTYGVFDITYASAEKDLYTPNSSLLTNEVYCINYKDVVLDAAKTTVFLNKENMRVGFGAISKGYAADRAKYVLQLAGVSSGVINAGGDLLTWGLQPDFTAWTVAAADTEQEGKPYAHINISDMAIATSVNAEKYAAINSSVSNTIDPQSGFIVSDIASVSIMGPTAEFADAMATPVMTIGINGGLYLVNKLNQIGCIIIDDHNRVYTSRDILITE
jgi:FAD:protein FMN transferase